MATPSTSTTGTDSRIRATAVHHARSIEDKKKLQTRIADLVVAAFDLPSNADADPANPAASDARLFKECLALFRPSDLDDLIYERNVDDRCGYALCPRPNAKLNHDGQKVWNKKAGSEFKLVDKSELEKWCSRRCGERGVFVKAQLSKEPAWLRNSQNTEVRLLDEVRRSDELADALKELSINGVPNDDIAEKLKALSLERGETKVEDVSNKVSILERETVLGPSRPPTHSSVEVIEGHHQNKLILLRSKQEMQF